MGSRFFSEETGEIQIEPDFVKLYIGNLCDVKGLSGLQAAMFNFMLNNMNHHNCVAYGGHSKNKFLASSQISNQTFNNNVNSLIKANLIERVCKGEFRVNKKYASKVDWSRVQKIVWTTEYTAAGKVEKVEIE